MSSHRSQSAVFNAISAGSLALVKRSRRAVKDHTLFVIPPPDVLGSEHAAAAASISLPSQVATSDMSNNFPMQAVQPNEGEQDADSSSEDEEVLIVEGESIANPVPVDDDEGGLAKKSAFPAHTTSYVYAAFEKTAVAHEFCCRLCRAKVSLVANSKTGTKNSNTNMKRHLNIHADLLIKFNRNKKADPKATEVAMMQKAVDAVQAARSASNAGQKRMMDFGFSTDPHRKATAKRMLTFSAWIYASGAAPSIVDDPFFKEFLKYRVDSKGHVLSDKADECRLELGRKHLLGRSLDDMFLFVNAALQKMLSAVQFFSICFDSWDSAAGNSFVAVNYFYIDDDWKYKAFLGDLIPLDESHTSLALALAIAARVCDKVPEHAWLVSSATDNAANVVLASWFLHKYLPDLAKGIPINDAVRPDPNDKEPCSVGCVSHLIALALNEFLDDSLLSLRKLIDKVRRLIAHVKNSKASRRALRAHTRWRPLLDNVTRWNSLHRMLERFVKLYPFLQKMASEKIFDEAGVEFVNSDSAAIIMQMCKVLELVRDLSVFTQSTKMNAMSALSFKIVATFKALRDASAAQSDAPPALKRLASQVYDCLERRIGHLVNTPGICLVAAALDPHHGHLNYISDELRDEVWKLIELWAQEIPRPANPAASSDGIAGFEVSAEEIRAAVRKIRRHHENLDVSKMPTMTELEYWGRVVTKENSPYALLSHVARFVFCVPVGSAASETSFSGAGHIVSKRRTSLKPHKVEKLAIVRDFVMRFEGDVDSFMNTMLSLIED